MNHFPLSILSATARALPLFSLVLLSACASTASVVYPPVNTSLTDTKEWQMPLHREPGHLQFKMQIPRQGLTAINLFPAQKFGEAPVRILFYGGECASGPEAQIKFYTSHTESFFKYFRAPLRWEDELSLTIDWDMSANTSIAINGEIITVQPHISFEKIEFRNDKEAIKIKEARYTAALPAAASSASSSTPAISNNQPQGQQQ